jgi:2-polyprenyl-3-methyl-5-hydroxy-6-metoxy-1,4-benzoquinol methylase
VSDPGRPLRPPRPWPARPAATGELIERLNREWRVTAPSDTAHSSRQRLAQALRRALAALLRPQETFNSAVVQQINHLNQSADVAFERGESLRAMVEDMFFRTEVLFDRVEGVAGQLDAGLKEIAATLDDMRRLPEALAAGERRISDGVAALTQQQAELRTAVGVLQHEARQLSRAMTVAPVATAPPDDVALPVTGGATTSDALSHKYVGFEDAFRGSPEAIREALAAYVPLFAQASDVLDIGCGRGEFLSLLRDAGVSARGIDLNEAMVEVCRGRGLQASTADALSYLRQVPDGSLGGLFAAQVVEHLEPWYLTQLLDTAFVKLRPGAIVVLETINPACWFAFFESYIRDITHQRPLHPDTLRYLLVATGFQQVDIRYSAPYPAHEKLQPVAASGLPMDTAEALNANVEKINSLLFTYLDYAAIARRP